MLFVAVSALSTSSPPRRWLQRQLCAAALSVCLQQPFPMMASTTSAVAARTAVEEVWDLLDQYYYDGEALSRSEWKAARQRLGDEAARTETPLRRATLQALHGDRYTRLLDKRAYEEISRFDILGVGLILAPGDDEVARVVSPPIPGSSGAKADVRQDDVVESIDGVATKGRSSFDLLDVVTANDRPTVRLVLRRGDDRRTLDLARRVDVVDPVGRVDVSPDGVAYVRLREFNARAAPRLATVLADIRRRGATRLVLDLRGNPGGAFQAAVNAASLFLPPDSPAVTVLERRADQLFKTSSSPKTTTPSEGFRVELWLDSNSASASEIFAAALRDNCAAVVAGDRPSYGKGLIQAVFGLQDDAGGLVVTVAQYLTPKGNPIQGVGVKPDIPLPPTLYLAGPRKLPDKTDLDRDFASIAATCTPPPR
ncbi:hypothetical protein CTAYLR_005596 [Chrysophaeum taylorii]|uniref:Tail specific protease domain-containing protein n=1 Tax=Chrysophaeum taylorii TaxID=2483200 RepID=A0AAD7XFZ2_9STRA|nr:hypothetical protein CTAYLR_005596 [Chrysophaeum taylorii]